MAAVFAGWIISAVGATGFAASVISSAVSLAFSFAVAKITQPKGPKPKDLQNEIRQTDAPRTRLLGRNKVSGVVLFWDWANVAGKRTLFKLFAVGEGGISGVDSYWLNDKPVSVTGGSVTTAPYGGRVRLQHRTGWGTAIDGGAYSALLAAFSSWTADHKSARIGTVLAEFDAVSGEDVADVYPGGEPKVLALVRGAPCYDPTSGNSAYSENLGAQLRDILTHPVYGCLGPDELDAASVAQTISDCAQPVAIKAGGTMMRYWGGGGYRLSEPVKDVAQRWLDAMGGTAFVTVEGKIGFRAGVWREPRFTITEDRIVSMDYGPGSGEFEVVTSLLPKYTAPEVGWQDASADQWDDPVAIARYGEVSPRELDVPVVQHHGQARRLAKIKAAKLNPKWRFNLTLRFWGLLLLEEDKVLLNLPRLGIINQPFWIESYEFNAEAGIATVSLIHARRESFDWNPATEEGEPPKASTTEAAAAASPPVITSVTVVNNTNAEPFIQIGYTTPALWTAIGQFRRSGSTDQWTAMVAQGQGGSLRTLGLADGEYDVRLALSQSGWSTKAASPWVTETGISVVRDSVAPGQPEQASVSGPTNGPVTVKFSPALGSNYDHTQIIRAEPDARSPTGGSVVATAYDKTPEVSRSLPLPVGGASFWLVSRNASGVSAAPVLAGIKTP